MKKINKLLNNSAAVAVALATAPAAHAHSYYNLTGAGTVASGDSAIGFGIANSINGTDGVSANSNGTNRVTDGTNIYGTANTLISGTGSATGTAEISGNLPYMWYSGQHTDATGVTKREIFTGSSVADITGNLINITGTGNGNAITLPNGQIITAPATGTWGSNTVASQWNAYSTKNGLAPTANAGNASGWGTIMADLPANGDHPYIAVAGNSAISGLGLDYGLIHVSCGVNSVDANCASAGDVLTTITVKNDSDYSQLNGLLDVALYRSVDSSQTSDRNAAATLGDTNIQGSSLGSAIWKASMTNTSDTLFHSFIFNQAEWLATGNANSGTNGFYTLIVGAHGGLATSGVAYDVLVTTSAVPVPGAVWLFGSALAGLVGFGRRKQHLVA